jgi:alkyldihydroxyacetonephosphate synthase
VTPRRRKHWGWGHEDDQLPPAELARTAAFLSEHLGFGARIPEPFVALTDVVLPAPRLAAPPALAGICTADAHERARHTYGSSYRMSSVASAASLSIRRTWWRFPVTSGN